MSDPYQEKEDAKSALESALINYKQAAEAYGYGAAEMREEIDNVFADAGFNELEVVET